MTDPNLTDFYGRVARIQKAHDKGYGFEAAGTLGRSYYFRPRSKRRPFIWPVLFLLVCTVLLKGVVYHSVGAETYNDRVAILAAGEWIERAGAWLMQAEPATIFVSDQITAALAKTM